MLNIELPGAKWFEWLRNLTLRVGVLTGVYLIMVMVVSVLAANRLHFLEDIADLRNAASYFAFVLVMLVPMVTFRRRPLQLLAAGLLGWLIFALAYNAMGLFFLNLHARLRPPFNVFMIGVIVYAVVAAASWVVTMALELRSQQQPAVSPSRKP